MKIVLLFLISMVLIKPIGFAADFIPQKIGISIDTNSASSNLEVILLKTILARASTNKNIYLFHNNIDELESFGIKKINASILLKTLVQSNICSVQLFSIENNSTNLFTDTIFFTNNRFIDSLTDTVQKVILYLESRFPPKSAEEIKEIIVERIAVSEFEKETPGFALKIVPLAFSSCAVNFRVSTLSNNSQSGYHFNYYYWGIMPELLFNWRFLTISLGTELDLPLQYPFQLRNSTSKLDLEFGLFGSLIKIGAAFRYQSANFVNTNYLWYSYLANGTNSSKQLVFPDFNIWNLSIAGILQLNISKNYNFQFIFGPSCVKSGFKLDFKNNTNYQSTNISYQFSGWGGIYSQMLFNYQILPNTRLSVHFIITSADYNTDWFGINNKPRLLTAIYGQDWYLTSFNYTKVLWGIGYEYEF